MPFQRIEAEFDGEVAYLTLAHPPVNVIDFAMIAEMLEFLGRVRTEPRLCAIVLQGSGKLFSAGVDIPSHLPETVEAMLDEFHNVFALLDEIAVPTVALVRGACLGGACELACYSDLVLASENARFGLPEIKLGVYPPVAAAIFPQRFGYQGIMRLLFTGETIDAAAAVRVGMASRSVREEDAAMALEETLQLLREKSAPALRAIKRANLRARGATFRELVRPSEEVYLQELMATADSMEGLRAFMEKRQPHWVHQ
jgi:cyclohexa-1,5-dienecarbonyl-CoA hydratase